MVVDLEDSEHSALLEHIEDRGRHYESFPEPEASLENERVSNGAPTKLRFNAIVGKSQSYFQLLFNAFHSTRLLQDDLSSTSSDLEDGICCRRVC